ncbi:MAG: EVE domain-containing protein [Candidatus Sericytochromatia bacterium]
MQHWLMKSEPHVYGLAQLARDGETGWEGVRNYQARNLMRDSMQVGDPVLFYHSSCDPPGVAGLAEVSQVGLVDPSQFDSTGDYFDPKATLEIPRWIMVAIRYVSHFPHFVALSELREQPELAEMMVLQRGARLSVQPVSAPHFDLICRLGQQ